MLQAWSTSIKLKHVLSVAKACDMAREPPATLKEEGAKARHWEKLQQEREAERKANGGRKQPRQQ
eukprot:6194926-Pleurochrysis_carterae.AAC.3